VTLTLGVALKKGINKVAADNKLQFLKSYLMTKNKTKQMKSFGYQNNNA
jgi:hypothetical protein